MGDAGDPASPPPRRSFSRHETTVARGTGLGRHRHRDGLAGARSAGVHGGRDGHRRPAGRADPQPHRQHRGAAGRRAGRLPPGRERGRGLHAGRRPAVPQAAVRQLLRRLDRRGRRVRHRPGDGHRLAHRGRPPVRAQRDGIRPAGALAHIPTPEVGRRLDRDPQLPHAARRLGHPAGLRAGRLPAAVLPPPGRPSRDARLSEMHARPVRVPGHRPQRLPVPTPVLPR